MSNNTRELDKFGLTKEAILDGDYAELDPVENPRKVKEPMYLQKVVDSVIESAFKDLESAYRENDMLINSNNALQDEVSNLNLQISDLYEKASVKEADDTRLAQAEKVLTELDGTIATLKSKGAEDARRIQELQAQLKEAESEKAELEQLRQKVAELEEQDRQRESQYQALADDVNAVLDGLEEQFAHLTV